MPVKLYETEKQANAEEKTNRKVIPTFVYK